MLKFSYFQKMGEILVNRNRLPSFNLEIVLYIVSMDLIFHIIIRLVFKFIFLLKNQANFMGRYALTIFFNNLLLQYEFLMQFLNQEIA